MCLPEFRARFELLSRIASWRGITTWRESTGGPSWRGHDFYKLSTKAAFIDDPSRIWQYNHYLGTMMLTASPNAAHLALARLALPSLRHKLAPRPSAFTLITQNIDGLDGRALEHAFRTAGLPSPLAPYSHSQSSSPTPGPTEPESETGSGDPLLLEMHGHVAGVLCTDYECRPRVLDPTTPLCPALAGTERVVDARPSPFSPPSPPSQPQQPKRTLLEARAWAAAKLAGMAPGTEEDENGEGEPDIAMPDLPRCPRCGSLLRPDMVWFTEAPHRITEVVRVVGGADVIMVVGTSAVVHPAAAFAAKGKERGGTVAIFNVERSNRDELADFVFLGPCEEILPRVLDLGDE